MRFKVGDMVAIQVGPHCGRWATVTHVAMGLVRVQFKTLTFDSAQGEDYERVTRLVFSPDALSLIDPLAAGK